MRLRARFAVAVRLGQDLVELARCLVARSLRDKYSREMDARAGPAVRGGAVEKRPGGGLIGFLQREDSEELLRTPELVAASGDPSQVRSGLPRCLLGDIQLGEHQDVGVTKRAQRMRVLEGHDRKVRFPDPAKELRPHVIGPPGPRLRLDDVLECACRSVLIAALNGFRREHEETILGADGFGVELDRGDVLVERPRAGGIRRDRIPSPQQCRIRLVLESREQRLV